MSTELLEYLARGLVDEPDAVRVERVERDESVGPIPGCADRFEAEVGRSVLAAAGLSHRD